MTLDSIILASAAPTSAGITGGDILSLGGLIIGAILAYLGTKATAKAQISAKKIESSGPAWADFVEKMETQQREHVAYLEKKHQEAVEDLQAKHDASVEIIEEKHRLESQELRKRLADTEEEIKGIRAEVAAILDKYTEAIKVLRDIFDSDEKLVTTIVVPDDILKDIDNL